MKHLQEKQTENPCICSENFNMILKCPKFSFIFHAFHAYFSIFETLKRFVYV